MKQARIVKRRLTKMEARLAAWRESFGNEPDSRLDKAIHRTKKPAHWTVCANIFRRKFTHKSGGYGDYMAAELPFERRIDSIRLSKKEQAKAIENGKRAIAKSRAKIGPVKSVRRKVPPPTSESVLGHVFFHDKVEEYEGPRPDLSLQCGDRVQFGSTVAVVAGRSGDRIKLCITADDGSARFKWVPRCSIQ